MATAMNMIYRRLAGCLSSDDIDGQPRQKPALKAILAANAFARRR